MSEQNRPRIEVFPLREAAPAEEPSEMHFLIRITAPEAHVEKARPQLNLGLVLDRSGSMSGAKIEKAKEAACYCVDQLAEEDKISVTIFDDVVDVIVPATAVKDRPEIKRRIASVGSRNSTALHAAWVKGSKQVAESLDPQSINRVILITDGLANVGETNTDKIVSQAKGLYERGISTSTIGVGNDFNEDLLVPMARASGGNSWFVEGPEDFQRIFETEMEGLFREVCSRVSLRIETESGTKVLDLLNDFERTDTGDFLLPNLLAGEPLDVIVKVLLSGGTVGQSPVFNLSLSWIPQGNIDRESTRKECSIVYAASNDIKIQSVNPEVQKALQLLEAARIKRKAMEYMDEGDLKSATDSLLACSSSLSAVADSSGDPDLLGEVENLHGFLMNLEERKDLARSRKSMAYQSSNAQRGRKEKTRQ